MKKKFIIEGMSCEHCIRAVEKNLSRLNLEAFDVKIGFAEIEFDEAKTSEKEIENSIVAAGYKIKK
jgi:copper chaperone CopZ